MADQLSLSSLSHSLGGVPVLAGIDLAVPAGRVVGLLGPSGCGKTTLARLVAGFERPDSGSIELSGRPVSSSAGVWVPAEQRRVGVVPQEAALFGHLDVVGNIGFGLARRGHTAAGRARVGHLMELVGLAGLGKRRCHELSGGQQQRVAVARALAPSPELVCLDEPFSALDANLRSSVREAVMGALRAERSSVLLVTHDQDEALSAADLVAVMLGGRIAQVGTPQQVYEQPASAEVAGFLGEAILLPGLAEGGLVDCELGRLGLRRPAQGVVTVLLRPEQVRVAAPAPATRRPSPDPLTGTGVLAQVVSVSFHGHDALVELRTSAGTALKCRMLPDRLPMVGQQVQVSASGRAWPLAA